MKENKPLRILYAVPSPSSTGGMRMISQMFYDFGLFDRNDVFHFDTYYTLGESKWIRAIQSLLQKVSFVFVLLRKRIDVVYVMTSSNWGFYDKVIFCLLARLVGVKSVLNPVGGHFIIFHQRNAFNRFWVPVCLGIPNAVISGTSYWHNYFNSQFKIKVLVDIPNPVRLKTMPLEPDCPGRPFTLTYLARVEFDKGIDIFLEVMNQLKERKDDSQFVIAGTGSKLQWVKDTLETPEWEGNVRIAGFVDELAKDKIFRETDVYLLPTEFEVLPISILEAMSFGNIVITTPVGGIPDAIIHGSTGILKERIDLNGIVSSILELKSNPRLRERISQNAIRHCKGKYDMNVVVAEQMKLFNSIME